MIATMTDPRGAASAFALAVREHLDDLPAEQVDELTEGLEADLLERAADTTGGDAFGDAREYAGELRSAAGLPPRIANPKSAAVAHSVKEFAFATAARVHESKLGAWLIDFLVALRPVWWVLRGWSLAVIVTLFISGRITSYQLELVPTNPALTVIYGAFIVVSVQWGRGRWLRYAWLKVVRVIASIIAVFALWTIAASVIAATSGPQYYEPETLATDRGLWYDGQEVQNIFAYDAAGEPLQFVQLYTDTGEPLTTMGANADDPWNARYLSDGSRLVPPTSEHGSTAWNVFPLHSVAPHFGLGQGHEQLPTPPFAQARPLVGGADLVQTCEVPPQSDESATNE